MLGYTGYFVKQSERLCKSEYTGTARFLGIRQGALLSSAERNELVFTVDILSLTLYLSGWVLQFAGPREQQHFASIARMMRKTMAEIIPQSTVTIKTKYVWKSSWTSWRISLRESWFRSWLLNWLDLSWSIWLTKIKWIINQICFLKISHLICPYRRY